MEKADHSGQTLINCLGQSLDMIRNAQGQLGEFGAANANPADLVSRIRLCNLLLWEISGVRRRLAKDLTRRASASFHSTERAARH